MLRIGGYLQAAIVRNGIFEHHRVAVEAAATIPSDCLGAYLFADTETLPNIDSSSRHAERAATVANGVAIFQNHGGDAPSR